MTTSQELGLDLTASFYVFQPERDWDSDSFVELQNNWIRNRVDFETLSFVLNFDVFVIFVHFSIWDSQQLFKIALRTKTLKPCPVALLMCLAMPAALSFHAHNAHSKAGTQMLGLFLCVQMRIIWHHGYLLES